MAKQKWYENFFRADIPDEVSQLGACRERFQRFIEIFRRIAAVSSTPSGEPFRREWGNAPIRLCSVGVLAPSIIGTGICPVTRCSAWQGRKDITPPGLG